MRAHELIADALALGVFFLFAFTALGMAMRADLLVGLGP
jgi:hypothetical protein